MDKEWVQDQFRRQPEKSQSGLARALGIDPSGVTRLLKGDRQIKAFEVPKIRAYFGLPESGSAEQTSLHRALEPSIVWDGPDSLPVMGTGEGGKDGQMDWNGEVVDMVRRPPFLGAAKGAYALYVRGSSMSPRYEDGDIVYVNPARPTGPGAYVVVQFYEREGEAVRAVIKQLVRRTDAGVTLRQFNPAKEFMIASDRVQSVHKIVGASEM